MNAFVDAPVQFPRKLSFKNFFLAPARYKVARGGRGSSKSWSFARALVLIAASRPVRILCARELQVSIKDSVYKLLTDQIEDLGLGTYFEYGVGFIRSTCGSEFLFKGLRSNAQEVKSTEKIDICWVEEAQAVSEASWVLLIPTIRAPDSQIWITYNPTDEEDPTHVRFTLGAASYGNDLINVEINYWDNPWFPKVLRDEMERDKKRDYEAYLHIWEGQCTKRSDAQVLFGKWRMDAIKIHKEADFLYGVDWGFATDPSVMTRSYVWDNRLYITNEAWQVGCELQNLPRLFCDNVPNAKEYVSRADNARPETIRYMRRKGFNITAAKKWPGSVEDGVGYLREFDEIIIDQHCKKTLQEARLWSYKIHPKTGDVMPILVDKWNHCWDSVRYAHEPLISQRRVRIAK